MRFIMIMYPNPKTTYVGSGMPDAESVAAMTRYNQKLTDANVLLSLDGFQGPDKGVRVRYINGKASVSEPPFSEANEIVGGYWMIRVGSLAEAVEWATRIPAADGDMVEVRQVFEMSDFPADVQRAAKL
jgi:hypothetical protein